MVVPGATDNSRKGQPRDLRPPGTHFESNDVRVNPLALSLFQFFRQPLPEVLRTRVMAPTGAAGSGPARATTPASPTSSIAAASGRGSRSSPPTGSTRSGRRRQPNPGYGLLWWLSTGRALYPSAPAASLFALDGGAHVLWLDPDLVMVVRWVDKPEVDGLLARILASRAA
ncbi:MAG: hypothetical protein HYY95_16365 [Candidatus Rokubacteria bacterium]|nr:hypothetical protein [Candidatus Rokubacteria bacterium]MBI2526810.1 hypothetical protein [Candidatus Rokubacteria bacterium]MBI3107112.1 hypothetical protein [Candidatus Rokubacteria bacterium]